jgi:hypothetical protein
LKDLNQKTVTDKKLATVLCEVLGSATKVENPIKLYGWYVELNKSAKLSLDNSDERLLHSFIENNDNIFLFVKGQLLDILNQPNKK